ncbi:MAG: transposase [Saprospiraceae bacterium]|nr:transposase [Saprospiraceae bacterium]
MLILRGQDRHQMQFYTLEDRIAPDNPVRFVDAFVDKIDPDKLGFAVRTVKTEGRPAYESKLFLKIYLYGYLNGIRSSRKLERECGRNTELQWLTGNCSPIITALRIFVRIIRKHSKGCLNSLYCF